MRRFSYSSRRKVVENLIDKPPFSYKKEISEKYSWTTDDHSEINVKSYKNFKNKNSRYKNMHYGSNDIPKNHKETYNKKLHLQESYHTCFSQNNSSKYMSQKSETLGKNIPNHSLMKSLLKDLNLHYDKFSATETSTLGIKSTTLMKDNKLEPENLSSTGLTIKCTCSDILPNNLCDHFEEINLDDEKKHKEKLKHSNKIVRRFLRLKGGNLNINENNLRSSYYKSKSRQLQLNKSENFIDQKRPVYEERIADSQHTMLRALKNFDFEKYFEFLHQENKDHFNKSLLVQYKSFKNKLDANDKVDNVIKERREDIKNEQIEISRKFVREQVDRFNKIALMKAVEAKCGSSEKARRDHIINNYSSVKKYNDNNNRFQIDCLQRKCLSINEIKQRYAANKNENTHNVFGNVGRNDWNENENVSVTFPKETRNAMFRLMTKQKKNSNTQTRSKKNVDGIGKNLKWENSNFSNNKNMVSFQVSQSKAQGKSCNYCSKGYWPGVAERVP